MLASIISSWSIIQSQDHLAIAVLTAVLVAAAYTLSTSKNSSPRTKDGKPLPRPATTLPLLENTLDFLRNRGRMHDWICETSLKFGGKPWLLRTLAQPQMVIITSPEGFEDVERKHFDKFGKGPYLYDYLFDFLGDGIVNVDGKMWAYQRKTAMGLFSSRALREHMMSIINKHSITLDSVLEKAANTESELDISKLLHQFTMEAFTEIGFGLELDCLGSDETHPFEAAFDDAQHAIMTRMQLPTCVWKLQRLLGIGLEGHLKKCIALVNETVVAIIKKSMASAQDQQQRKSATPKKKDIVSIFLESENSEEKMSPVLLRDIVLNLLLGGRDTSAEALSWLFFCLSQNPEVEHKIREEIAAHFDRSINASTQLSIDTLQSLTYLEAALKETLRLFPAANFNMRYCYEDVVMSDGTFIPAGCYAVICPFTTGRRTDVWGPDAREFKPERWLDESGKMLSVSSFKFNSFLGGPRACIGMNLAMMQMKMVVVKTLLKFHLVVSDDQSVTYRHAITLPMKDGMRVRVERV